MGHYHTGNVDLIERFIAPGYTEVHDGERHVIGVEGAKAHILGVRQTYPDLYIAIERLWSAGASRPQPPLPNRA